MHNLKLSQLDKFAFATGWGKPRNRNAAAISDGLVVLYPCMFTFVARSSPAGGDFSPNTWSELPILVSSRQPGERELGEDLLDRIEVWTVGRQEEQMRSFGANGVAGRLAFVATEIVEDNDFAPCQRGRQHLFDIKREQLAIDGGSQ